MRVNPTILQRYLQDPPARRMGNLGSELLRLSKAVYRGDMRAVLEFMDLSLSYIEEGGKDFPEDAAEQLANLQRILLAQKYLLKDTLQDFSRRLQFSRELELYAEFTVRLIQEC